MNTTAKKLIKNTAASLAVGFAAACALILCGCSSLREKAFITDAYGAFADKSGTAGLGKLNIMTVPQEQAFIHAEYEEDTAFFSPSTKIASWTFTWSGGVTTNATDDAAAKMLKALTALATKKASAEETVKAAAETSEEK
jgi:hypothetical protein